MSLKGRILITGGTGTLGYAILRTAEAECWDADFTIFSRSELLQAQMKQRYPQARYILGDVRDAQRVSDAIAGHDVVIHAAAMKRIPECEQFPTECYQTNVFGSANVIRACQQHNVQTCIGISTDKACQAITAYGASKLLMEKLFQSVTDGGTRFVLCRYGNVVASRGSVIPLWRKQVADRMPLTITDPEMTRFFMAESDAVATIQRAAYIAKPGMVVIPKMRRLKITALANALFPSHEQQIVGLRSMEKAHEWLIDDNEARYTFCDPLGEDYFYFGVRPVVNSVAAYTSEYAEPLAIADFMSMLAEAEAAEVLV